MRVTIMGPNIGSGGEFDIHAEGCADLKRNRRYALADPPWSIDAASQSQVIFDVYADIIAEHYEGETPDDAWRNYADEFTFYPCVGPLPEETFAREGDHYHRWGPVEMTTQAIRRCEVVGCRVISALDDDEDDDEDR